VPTGCGGLCLHPRLEVIAEVRGFDHPAAVRMSDAAQALVRVIPEQGQWLAVRAVNRPRQAPRTPL
jgi:hypothetical protein